MSIKNFKTINVVDFEFRPGPTGISEVVCLVVKELLSGSVHSYIREELIQMTGAPFDIGEDSLFVCYSGTAELGCFRALGWTFPHNIVDLHYEYLNFTNTEPKQGKVESSLRAAVNYFGCGSIDPQEKDNMRDLIIRQTTYSSEEIQQILSYCLDDVEHTARLYMEMGPHVDLEYALYRGEYGKALTDMEIQGVPVDVDLYERLKDNWPAIRLSLIDKAAAKYGVFEHGHLRFDLLENLAGELGIPWPRSKYGRLKTDKNTLKELALRYPELEFLTETLQIYRQMNDFKFPVGPDGRNHFSMMPYSSKTGRNQPKTSECILAGPAWIRGLIQPKPDCAIAYIDWERQEFGMGAALSGDLNMKEAYQSDDCYMAFGVQAGVVPAGATKATHPRERSMLKSALLSIQYQSSAKSLASKIGVSESEAAQLINLHEKLYSHYWDWVESVETAFLVESKIESVYGWTLHSNPGKTANMRAVSNFPVQADGAEMMRLACCIGNAEGVNICATLHDAFLIEAPVEDIDLAVAIMISAMNDASRSVLDGFTLKTEAQIFRYPDRFSDPRGKPMWNRVMALLDKVEQAE